MAVVAVAALVVGGLVLVLGGSSVAAESPEVGSPREGGVGQESAGAVAELAARHAPVVMLKEQREACDSSGESYAPIAVDFVIDNPSVVLRQVGNGDPVLMVAPGRGDLFSASSGVFLDFPGDALSPGCVYEADSQRYVEASGATVFAHVVQEAGRPDLLALQYWFFWYFNDWNNRHEGDWEGIQLLFEASTVEEALERGPVSVGYAQHEGGEVADWDSDKLERVGDRPVVYPSAGSHASYFGSAVYLGRSGAEGFGCDVTTGPSRRVDPAVVVLPDEVTDPADPLAWLAYPGRWGEMHGGPLNGPTGPASKGRWTEPVSWHEELRNAGVQVPTGGGFGTDVIELFCGVAEQGSLMWIDAQQEPVRVLLPLLLAGAVGLVLVRRASWLPVVPLPVVARRSVGQVLTSSVTVYGRHWRRMLWVGLVFIPINFVSGLFVGLLSEVPGVSALLALFGGGVAGLPFALLLGGLGNTVAQLFVIAAIAVVLTGTDGSGTPRAGGPYEAIGERLRPLARAMLRAYAIVIALSVTVVGLPWALRQAVRYTFVPHAVMVEDRHEAEALDRSSALTRGRWWRTAWVVLLAGALVYGVAVAAGLIVLLLVPDLPIWGFNVVTSVALAAIVPWAATVTALLYGDLAAREADLRDDGSHD